MDHKRLKETGKMGLFGIAAAGMLFTGMQAAAKEAPAVSAGSPYEFVFDAGWYAQHYSDLMDAYGTDEQALFMHFKQYGMDEGRQASPYFDVFYYQETQPELKAQFGGNLRLYYEHFAASGYAEGRRGAADRLAPLKTALDNAEIEADSYAAEILQYTNEARLAAGVPALALNQALCNAADLRAGECISSYSHTRSDGRDFYTAAQEEGISYRSLGENLAKGYCSGRACVDGWLASPGHRENLLNPAYTEIGVSAVKAVTPDGQGGIWFSAQEFAALR